MADGENRKRPKELKIYPSRETRVYLEVLAQQGLRGDKVPAVAVSLIGERIEQLIKDGLLEHRGPK